MQSAPPAPATLSEDLTEIDDMLITTALDTTQRNILRMRWIIVALLLLVNITAFTAYLNKKSKQRQVLPFNQALAYLEKSQPAKAQQAIERIPDGPDKTFLTALAAFKRRDFNTCSRLLARLRGDNYFTPYVHAMKGYVLFRKKQYAKAYKCFSQAYALMPGMKNLKSNLTR